MTTNSAYITSVVRSDPVGRAIRTTAHIGALVLSTILCCAFAAAESLGEKLPDPNVFDGPRAGAWEKRASFLNGRIYHSAVWTYSEMIVWGGGSEHRFFDDGGIY